MRNCCDYYQCYVGNQKLHIAYYNPDMSPNVVFTIMIDWKHSEDAPARKLAILLGRTLYLSPTCVCVHSPIA